MSRDAGSAHSSDGEADAIIVAAGASRRMAGVDKLEADIHGRPLLAWAVEAMARADGVRNVVVVVSPTRLERMQAASWMKALGARVVAGGDERSDSVRSGLAAVDAEVVLVHDGARPLATPELAESVRAAAWRHGAAVPVVAMAESVKRTDGDFITRSIDRTGLVRTQTPQAARRELLEAAFASAGTARFTDEAALLEAAGTPVATVPGEPANLKVTEPADLDLVRDVVAGRAAGAQRVGLGSDSHPFGPEQGLWLGGLFMPQAPRLHGHSDGDAALHALATAVLSGCGLGDVGRQFPATEATHHGAASAGFLAESVALAAGAGWRPTAVQLSILGARPRLGGERLEAMRQRIAELLGTTADVVAVSASTGNLSGPEGEGRAIAATALVTLVRR